MPYIQETSRGFLDKHIQELSDRVTTEGEICYVIYALLVRYCEKNKSVGLFCFRIISQCISAIECAKLELYRRIVAPYEDKKIQENGDVL